jgi:hypothetical protein
MTADNFLIIALLLVLCNIASRVPLPLLALLPSEMHLEAAVEKAERILRKNHDTSLSVT